MGDFGAPTWYWIDSSQCALPWRRWFLLLSASLSCLLFLSSDEALSFLPVMLAYLLLLSYSGPASAAVLVKQYACGSSDVPKRQISQ